MTDIGGEGQGPEPIDLTIAGDPAAIVWAEAEVSGLSAEDVVGNALILFEFIAPEVRSGGKLLIATPEARALERQGLRGKLLKPFRRFSADDYEVREITLGDLCGKPLNFGELDED